MQGDKPSLNIDNTEDDGQELSILDEDTGEVTEGDISVMLGCKIMAQNEYGDVKSYVYDYLNGQIPYKVATFADHKVGDVVEIDDVKWKILDISL